MIFRYQFTDVLMHHLREFSLIHQFDDNQSFQEAWKEWVKENECMVNVEVERMKEMGYKGNVMDKMYKSARYYYKNKTSIVKRNSPSNFYKSPSLIENRQKRKTYVGVPSSLLVAMDAHMPSHLALKPQASFIHFCKRNEPLVKNAIFVLLDTKHMALDEIAGKIKKTFKNRYFRCKEKEKENNANNGKRKDVAMAI